MINARRPSSYAGPITTRIRSKRSSPSTNSSVCTVKRVRSLSFPVTLSVPSHLYSGVMFISSDLQLRTLAPPLATHLNTQRLGQPRDPIFDQVCRQLSDERTSEPYLRAIFAYCATGDWHEVIDETGLPLKDRLAVGLRFLNDDEIFHWLEATARDSIQSGDLEGILLTGLNIDVTFNRKTEETHDGKSGYKSRPDETDHLAVGFRLIQTYVNRTGDLQTAALVSYLQVPTRLRHPTAERWIESYRRLLDRWTLFNARIEFDISRGQRVRQNRTIIRHGSLDGTEISMTKRNPNTIPSLDVAPPQLMVRCQHCLEVVSDGTNVTSQLNRIARLHSQSASLASTSVLGSAGLGLGLGLKKTGHTSINSKQSNRCRTCGKSLPKCSICMIPLMMNDSHTTSVWAWCHKCRHVGHANHLREWQERGNLICPVSGCECACWETAR